MLVKTTVPRRCYISAGNLTTESDYSGSGIRHTANSIVMATTVLTNPAHRRHLHEDITFLSSCKLAADWHILGVSPAQIVLGLHEIGFIGPFRSANTVKKQPENSITL